MTSEMSINVASALMIAAAALAATLAGGCARSQPPPVTPADTARATARWPGITADQLQQGRVLYMERCSDCHVPVDPRAIRAELWPAHVAQMRDRAHLEPAQAELIERYLVTMAMGTAAAQH